MEYGTIASGAAECLSLVRARASVTDSSVSLLQYVCIATRSYVKLLSFVAVWRSNPGAVLGRCSHPIHNTHGKAVTYPDRKENQ